MHLKTMNIAV